MSTPTPRRVIRCDECGHGFYPAQIVMFRGRRLCSETALGRRDGCFCKDHLRKLAPINLMAMVQLMAGGKRT